MELLRAYLEYAALGGQASGTTGGGAEARLHPLQADILAALEGRGLELTAQWGASRYRIDFAVQSAEDESRFLLALETDGPGYRAVPTARERDRTREQVLEGLGWTFHRIWATDWFMRREEEIERCVQAFEEAGVPAAPVTPATAPPPAGATAPDAGGPGRGQRPRIGRRGSIDHYAARELVAMVAWVQSDGRLRTDEEIVDELVDTLGFSRRGPRIEAALRGAVGAYRMRHRP